MKVWFGRAGRRGHVGLAGLCAKSVDNLHQVIHTRAPKHAETTLSEFRETALVQTDQMDAARAELLAEAIADVGTRARSYLQEPADASWHELLEALTRTYGDDETYDLLRAVTIHSQTSRR
jgi:hypothetical protein